MPNPAGTLPLRTDIRGSSDRVSVPGFSLPLLGFRAVRTRLGNTVLEGPDANLDRGDFRAPAHGIHCLGQVGGRPPKVLRDRRVLGHHHQDSVAERPGLGVWREPLAN